jgi:hypothetical protein
MDQNIRHSLKKKYQVDEKRTASPAAKKLSDLQEIMKKLSEARIKRLTDEIEQPRSVKPMQI